jgi:hypothetical protein
MIKGPKLRLNGSRSRVTLKILWELNQVKPDLGKHLTTDNGENA